MPPPPPFEVILATTPELVQACIDIRIEVFVVEQGFPLELEVDEYDTYSLSFLLNILEPSTVEGLDAKRVPVGTVRLVPGKNKVGRLAVLKDYRSYGFGRILMSALHKYALAEYATALKTDPARQAPVMQLSSQIYAIPFYAKFGYEKDGEEYDEDGAPHQHMTATLKLE